VIHSYEDARKLCPSRTLENFVTAYSWRAAADLTALPCTAARWLSILPVHIVHRRYSRHTCNRMCIYQNCHLKNLFSTSRSSAPFGLADGHHLPLLINNTWSAKVSGQIHVMSN